MEILRCPQKNSCVVAMSQGQPTSAGAGRNYRSLLWSRRMLTPNSAECGPFAFQFTDKKRKPVKYFTSGREICLLLGGLDDKLSALI